MDANKVVICIVIGLILWLWEWRPSLAKLNDVGRCIFLIAFAVWLGLFH